MTVGSVAGGLLPGIVLALSVLGYLLSAPAPASSNRPAEPPSAALVLEDADRFRAALGTVWTTLSVDRGRGPVARRVRWGPDTEGGTAEVVTIDPDEPTAWPIQLATSVLSRSPVQTAFRELGVNADLSETAWGGATLGGQERVVLRVGRAEGTHLLLEPGIWRPLRWSVGPDAAPDGERWTVDVPAWSPLASGWYPGRVEVFRADQRVLVVEVTDVAPSRDHLAPVEESVPLPLRTALPMPRLPL